MSYRLGGLLVLAIALSAGAVATSGQRTRDPIDRFDRPMQQPAVASGGYVAIRGTDHDPWWSLPGTAQLQRPVLNPFGNPSSLRPPRLELFLRGGTPAEASVFVMVKVDGRSGAVVPGHDELRSGDYVKIRGVDRDPWLVVPRGGVRVVTSDEQHASMFYIVKEAQGSSPGDILRKNDYFRIRSTDGDRWLNAPAIGRDIEAGDSGGLMVIADAQEPMTLVPPRQDVQIQVLADGTNRIQLGWMDLWPCSKLDFVGSSIPGVPAPRITTAEQRVTAYADVRAGNPVRELQSALNTCAGEGVVAAGIAAIIGSPAAAAPTFKAVFSACMVQRVQDFRLLDVNIKVESSCRW